MSAPAAVLPTFVTPSAVPRLGFLGIGWIGRSRMQAILDSGCGLAAAFCDSSPDMLAAGRDLAPEAEIFDTLESLLAMHPDGIVIATPSALHAEQSILALAFGVAVFCQKPLGRDSGEVAAVLEAARSNDLLLGVDLSYRHTHAMQAIRRHIAAGAIGSVYAADLVFHNAYGPDKPWFYDARLSGGGCVMDLGVHLVDLLLWTLDFPSVEKVSADLFCNGRKMRGGDAAVEDFAIATIELETGLVARLTCSWRLHLGRNAGISATFYGTEGSLRFANVDGSFYDFTAELRRGTQSDLLVTPPDKWSGRAATDWAKRLANSRRFDPESSRLLEVAQVLDRIYGK